MIDQTLYIESKQTYPYYNLALEEYLLDSVGKGQIILFLWQNKNTVVIGKNQNSWKECKIRELEGDGGYLVRRLSGGGAVYHDLGNLNFTFLVPTKLYNLEKQLDVILTAIRMLGLDAVKSGRNDILIDGMKFSGNAFLERRGKSYHHGTLMVNVCLQDLQKYLNVDREKLKSKSVDSVLARVANLTEFYPGLTVEMLKETLIKAFGVVYGIEPQKLNLEESAEQSIKEGEIRFASWEFKYGKKIEFQFEVAKRFTWGNICMQFQVDGGIIKDIQVYSDSMKQDLISNIENLLHGVLFDKMEVIQVIKQYHYNDIDEEEMCLDIISFIDEQNF